jgi:hypothetical protein
MAASRDIASACEVKSGWTARSGSDVVHEDMLDARPGVRYGCCDTEIMVSEEDMEEAREAAEDVDREDILTMFQQILGQ